MLVYTYIYFYVFALANVNGQVLPAPTSPPQVLPPKPVIDFPDDTNTTISPNSTMPPEFIAFYPKTEFTLLPQDPIQNRTEQILAYFDWLERDKGNKDTKVLKFAAGSFLMDRQVTVRSNSTEIVGAGINKTLITLADNTPPWLENDLSPKPGLFRVRYVEGFKMSALALDGNKANQGDDGLTSFGRTGVFVQASKGVIVKRVSFTNWQKNGMNIQPDKVKGLYPEDIRIEECRFEGNTDGGLLADHFINSVVSNNEFVGNGGNAMDVLEGSKNVSLEGNIISGSNTTVCGVNMEKAEGSPISGNVFANMTKAGVCTDTVRNISVTGNSIYSSLSCTSLIGTNFSVVNYNRCENITRINGKVNVEGFITCKGCANTTIDNNTFVDDNGRMISSSNKQSPIVWAMGLLAVGSILLFS